MTNRFSYQGHTEDNTENNNLEYWGFYTAVDLGDEDLGNEGFENIGSEPLGHHGPATAIALATSHTIHTANFGFENIGSQPLGHHGLATAIALATSHTIHTVDLGDEDLSNEGFENIGSQPLGHHGLATAIALATSHTLHTVDLGNVNDELAQYIPFIIAVFAEHNHSVALNNAIHQPECILSTVMPEILVDLIGDFLLGNHHIVDHIDYEL